MRDLPGVRRAVVHRRATGARGGRLTRAGAARAGFVLAASVALVACGRADAPARPAELSGEQLATRHCQSCHLLPSPALLDRDSWGRWVLPAMARQLGLNVGRPGAPDPFGRAALGVESPNARLSRAEWDRLAAYYLREAPAALPAPSTPPVPESLPGFRVRVPSHRVPGPMTTLVHVEPGRIYVGDATPGRGTLAVLDGRGRRLHSSPIASPVSQLRFVGDTLGLVFMGRLDPSDDALGSVALLPGGAAGWRAGAAPAAAWQVGPLQRPAFASYGDLSGDGVDDVVVSEFGYTTGRLAWYERLSNGGSRRHLLTAEPGAMTTVVRDFDGDGRADVLALTGQAAEGVSLFRNRPGGAFERRWLLRFPPSYGSSGMTYADVDGDGHEDIVYANGDNGDYPSPPKPYHGVRVFRNDGRGQFAERYFFPMPGAYTPVARDFDGDGDVDLAAIAFYADYASASPLPFVYLENLGGLRFRPATFPDANRGRWLTIAAGDVDADGDDDLVLGAFTAIAPAGDRRGLAARWRRPDAPTVLVLENTRRAAGR